MGVETSEIDWTDHEAVCRAAGIVFPHSRLMTTRGWERVRKTYRRVQAFESTRRVQDAPEVVRQAEGKPIERCDDCPRLYDTEGPRCSDCPPLNVPAAKPLSPDSPKSDSPKNPICTCGHPQSSHVIQIGKGAYGCSHKLWAEGECMCMEFVPFFTQEASDVQKQMAHDDSLITVLQNDVQRVRRERDDWRRKYFEMAQAHSNGVDNIGELTARILLRERELSERSSDKSMWEERALKAEAALLARPEGERVTWRVDMQMGDGHFKSEHRIIWPTEQEARYEEFDHLPKQNIGCRLVKIDTYETVVETRKKEA